MPRADQTADLDLVLSVDGPGVRRASVDVPLFLEICASFFQLVKANAGEDTTSLDLTGIRLIGERGAALAAGVSSADLARSSAEQAVRQIAGDEAPRGLARLADRARSAIGRLPKGHTAKVVAGPWIMPIVASRAQGGEAFEAAPLDAILAIRAVPLRAGGKKPAVRFQSALEGEFTLETTAAEARALGAHLYEEIDLVATVTRSAEGNIVSGQLGSFECLDEGGAAAAWRAWYLATARAAQNQDADLRTERRG